MSSWTIASQEVVGVVSQHVDDVVLEVRDTRNRTAEFGGYSPEQMMSGASATGSTPEAPAMSAREVRLSLLWLTFADRALDRGYGRTRASIVQDLWASWARLRNRLATHAWEPLRAKYGMKGHQAKAAPGAPARARPRRSATQE